MKRIFAWTMLSMTVFLTSTAWAQDDEVPTRFIDIRDALTTYGEIMRPDGIVFDVRERAEFDSLIHLRRTFVNEIIESADETN